MYDAPRPIEVFIATLLVLILGGLIAVALVWYVGGFC